MKVTTETYDIPGLEALTQLRDELRVQMHLAKMEARAQWEKLEPKWMELEGKLQDFDRATVLAAARELRQSACQLVKELHEGYQRVRTSL
jgi:hypothetical protein